MSKAKPSHHTPPPHGAGPYLADDALLEKALNARNSHKFARLWSGDTSDYGGDDSRADLALCGELAFWTQDAAQIDRLFRRSELYREKWQRADYRDATIAKALSQTTEHWTPPRPRSNGEPSHTSPTSEDSSKGKDPQTPGETIPPEPEHFTDLGNARRLVRLFGGDLRYCHDWRQWLIWDTTRWRQDRNGEIVRRAKRTVQALYTEAATIEDKDERKAAAKWALTSESDGRIQAMINLATSEPGIPVLPEELDADAWLLNCRNGTVNLRTGKLQGHRREDLLTKCAPVLYDPDAMCPEWTRFLQQIFIEKSDLIAFVRCAIGYSLTADVRERVLFIAHGKGRYGKSTLLELIAEMLGDYSLRTPTETLMVKPYHQIPNDLAQLQGRRFVHASESEEGKRLSESLIKEVWQRFAVMSCSA